MSEIHYTTENNGLHALIDGVPLTTEEQFDYDFGLYQQWGGSDNGVKFLETWEKAHRDQGCTVCS